MKKFLIGLFILFSTMSAVAQEESLFSEGNRLYAEGAFELALEQYEKVLQQGEASSALYFNLGNTAFKLDQLGQSLRYYKKSLKLDPRDPELKYNIRLLESQLKDQITPIPQNRLLQTYWKFVRSWSLDHWTRFFLIVYGLLFIFLIAHLLMRSLKKVLLRLILVNGIGCVVIALCFVGSISLYNQTNAIILSKEVPARFGPSETDALAFTLHEGTQCQLLSEKEEWAQIKLADGKIAWLPKKDLGLI